MKRQKRIALVNDITGFGRCSVTVELPLISAMKIQACPLPTAILSVHTGFPDHYLDDYTERMAPYIASWEKNGLAFDGICTGFLGSAEQIAIVLDFIRRFRGRGRASWSTLSWATTASSTRRTRRRCATRCAACSA